MQKDPPGQIKRAPAVPAGAPESIISMLESWRCIQSFFRTKLQLHLFSAGDKYFSLEASIVLCLDSFVSGLLLLRSGCRNYLNSSPGNIASPSKPSLFSAGTLLPTVCFFKETVAAATKNHRLGNNASPSKPYRFSAWNVLLPVSLHGGNRCRSYKIHREEQRFTFEASIDSLHGI